MTEFPSPIASIPGKILDFFSTERRFRAGIYPTIKIELHNGDYKDASTGEQAFYLKMTNLDDRRHALDPIIEISFVDPVRARFPTRWVRYVKEQVPDLAPGQTRDHIRLETQGSIESFIAKNFPMRILEEISRNPRIPSTIALLKKRSFVFVLR